MNTNPTQLQIEIARALSLDISQDNAEIAAARIHEVIWPAMDLKRSDLPVSDKQNALAKEINVDINSLDRTTAAKKIGARLNVLNELRLRELSLSKGDRVRIQGHGTKLWVVSCIGKNRRIFIKGLGGESFWATHISKHEKA